MQKLTSAKWVILLTVLINVVTTFTLVTIFPSGMRMANAKPSSPPAPICVINHPIFRPFRNNGDQDQYAGVLYANGDKYTVLANINITFSGTAQKNGNRGMLTAVDFSATASPSATQIYRFKDMAGAGLDTDTGINTYLSTARQKFDPSFGWPLILHSGIFSL